MHNLSEFQRKTSGVNGDEHQTRYSGLFFVNYFVIGLQSCRLSVVARALPERPERWLIKVISNSGNKQSTVSLRTSARIQKNTESYLFRHPATRPKQRLVMPDLVLALVSPLNDANSRSSKAIDAVCKTGKSYVSAYFHSINRTVSGQYAVNLVGDCLRLLAQADLEALTGTTEVSNASESRIFCPG